MHQGKCQNNIMPNMAFYLTQCFDKISQNIFRKSPEFSLPYFPPLTYPMIHFRTNLRTVFGLRILRRSRLQRMPHRSQTMRFIPSSAPNSLLPEWIDLPPSPVFLARVPMTGKVGSQDKGFERGGWLRVKGLVRFPCHVVLRVSMSGVQLIDGGE